MKRLFVFLIACVSGWLGYRQLRSHPRTASKVAEIERQSQVVVDKASDVVRSAKGQVVARAADMADTAATGAQDAIDTAAGKAHDALDAAVQKTRHRRSAPFRRRSRICGALCRQALPPSLALSAQPAESCDHNRLVPLGWLLQPAAVMKLLETIAW